MFNQLFSLKGKEVYHCSHNDHDGYAPQIVSKLSTLTVKKYCHCSYDRIDQELMMILDQISANGQLAESAILITDLSPTQAETMERLDTLVKDGLTVVLLDHHDTAKWIAEKYPTWAYIDSHIGDKPTCGTELFYLYLKEKELFEPYIADSLYFRDYVEQVRSYDTWDWTRTDNPFAKDLNALLYILTPSEFVQFQLEKIQESFNHDLGDWKKYTLNETEELLVEVEKKKEAKYIKSRQENVLRFVLSIQEVKYTAGVVFGDQYHSSMGNEISLENPDLDFVLLLDLNGSKGSLRTIHDHIHVGDIAKAIAGGGGHPKAAGFEFNRESAAKDVLKAIGLHLPGLV